MVEIFDEQTFYKAFTSDLRRARALVLIQSPFLALNRVDKLEPVLKSCVNRRVRVCIFAQEAQEPSASTHQVAAKLTAAGVHLNFSRFIHEKLAVIDESILWDGSLNILSQSVSKERMTRWPDKNMVFEAIVKHELNTCESCKANRQGEGSIPNALSEVEQLASIGLAISRRRKRLQMSQSQLAVRTGMHQSVISAIEGGKRIARIDTLTRICSHLDLEIRAVPWYITPAIDDIVRE